MPELRAEAIRLIGAETELSPEFQRDLASFMKIAQSLKERQGG
jgi:hypothetical protein